jgi:hypothetical protein
VKLLCASVVINSFELLDIVFLETEVIVCTRLLAGRQDSVPPSKNPAGAASSTRNQDREQS